MARSPSGRRGRGASDLGGTLGSLLRSTLEQAGAVREAFERSARTGRARIDEALSDRKRANALAELGEIVLELVRQGELDLEELPEIRDSVNALDRIDAAAEESRRDERDAALRRSGSQSPRYAFDERDVIGRRKGSTQPVPLYRDEYEGDEAEAGEGVDRAGEAEDPGVVARPPLRARRESSRGEPEELRDRVLDESDREAITQRLRSFAMPIRRALARSFERGADAEPEFESDRASAASSLEERERDDQVLAAAARGDALRLDDVAARRHGPRDRQPAPTRPGYLRGGEIVDRASGNQDAAPRRRNITGDDTVSSSTWKRQPLAQTQRVWRPIFDDAELAVAPGDSHEPPAAESAPVAPLEPGRPPALTVDEPVAIPGVVRYDDLQAAAGADAEVPEPERSSALPRRSGGISFDDDDLAEYMHPDDVPSSDRGGKRDPS
jgi:hypothetical protein